MALFSRLTLHIFLHLFLATLLFNLLAADVNPDLVGGWKPVDPKSANVQEIGKFAVTEHNKEAKAKLAYKEVVKADVQVVSGFNYRMVIVADDGIQSGKYQAVVWDQAWKHFRNLTSFVPIKNV